MSRIADYAAHTQITGYMLDIQNRVKEAQIQVSSEKKSQTYQGIAVDSQRLVTLENTVTALARFKSNNDTVDLRLTTAESALSGVESSINDFKRVLQEFKQEGSFDETDVASLQDWAFRSLQAMQGYLNTEADGRYIFSGTRVTTSPVDLGLTNLADFQSTYDGDVVTYPTTRDAHLLDAVTLTPTTTGNLTYTAGPPDTITAANVGGFAGLEAGAAITIAGSTANDGTYTIASLDATNTIITLTPNVTLTPAIGDTYTSISTSGNYYNGDRQSITHRVDDNQNFSYDVNAIDPAFEKAIRAMSIIAQGTFGTTGGLDQNTTRVDEALYLIDSSLDATTSGTPPYGPELSSNLTQLQSDIAFDRILIDNASESTKTLSAFFEGRISELENADPLETITRLLDDSRALEASYQALAKIRSLSLTNFLV